MLRIQLSAEIACSYCVSLTFVPVFRLQDRFSQFQAKGIAKADVAVDYPICAEDNSYVEDESNIQDEHVTCTVHPDFTKCMDQADSITGSRLNNTLVCGDRQDLLDSKDKKVMTSSKEETAMT